MVKSVKSYWKQINKANICAKKLKTNYLTPPPHTNTPLSLFLRPELFQYREKFYFRYFFIYKKDICVGQKNENKNLKHFRDVIKLSFPMQKSINTFQRKYIYYSQSTTISKSNSLYIKGSVTTHWLSVKLRNEKSKFLILFHLCWVWLIISAIAL